MHSRLLMVIPINFNMKPQQNKISLRELARLGICTALIFTAQVAMAALPNIEIVTLLLILYTLWFEKKALLILSAFVLLEGIFYGFHQWWFGYLYIWLLLWVVVRLLGKKERGTLFWACIGSGFGLLFGLLYAPVYYVIGGFGYAVSWWISGIPFDILHGAGNFLLILLLFSPLNRVGRRLLNL